MCHLLSDHIKMREDISQHKGFYKDLAIQKEGQSLVKRALTNVKIVKMNKALKK